MSSPMHFIRNLLLALLTMLAIIFIGLVVFLQVVDPNDYKDQLVHRLSQKLDANVGISGPIAWHFGSRLSLQVQGVSIHRPEQHSKLTLKEARLSVELLPLLRKQVIVHNADINDAQLVFDLSEKNLWLHNNAATSVQKSHPHSNKNISFPVNRFHIKKLSFLNTNVTILENGQPHSEYSGAEFNIKTLPGEQTARIQATVKTSHLQPIVADSTHEMKASLLWKNNTLHIDNLEWLAYIYSQDLPKKQAQMIIKQTETITIDDKSWNIPKMQLRLGGAQLSIDSKGALSPLTASGNVHVQNYQEEELIATIATFTPFTLSLDSARNAQLKFKYHFKNHTLSLPESSLQLGKTTGTGNFLFDFEDKAATTIHAHFETLDLKPWLMQANAATKPEKIAKPPSAKTIEQSKFSLCNTMHVNMNASIDTLIHPVTPLTNTQITLVCTANSLNIQTFKTKVGTGTISLNGALHNSKQHSQFTLQTQKLSLPLLHQFFQKPAILIGDLNSELKVDFLAQVGLQSLSGSGSFDILSAEILKIDLNRWLGQSITLSANKPTDLTANFAGSTKFDQLSGTFRIKQGICDPIFIKGEAPAFDLTAHGSLNLLTNYLDMPVTLIPISTKDGVRKQRGTVPYALQVHGTLPEIHFKPDLDRYLEQVVAPKAQKEIEKNVKKFLEKSGKSLENLLP